jgi:hypothetical protein
MQFELSDGHGHIFIELHFIASALQDRREPSKILAIQTVKNNGINSI